MTLYDSRLYPPLPAPSIKPVKERIAEALALRGQISERALHTIVAAIYGSARDCGDNSLDVPLKEEAPTPKMPPVGLSKIPMIQALVAGHFSLTVDELISKRRGAAIARARHVAMYLCRVSTAHSLGYIGRRFGRDHTTVMHSVRKVGLLIAGDAAFAREVEELKGGVWRE